MQQLDYSILPLGEQPVQDVIYTMIEDIFFYHK